MNWHKVIWDAASIPRHSVIASLAIQNAIPTYAKLMERGLYGPNHCVLCGSSSENISHIFFACNFSREVICGIKQWVNLFHPTYNILMLVWILRTCKAKFTHASILASIYFIWKERNDRIFGQRSSTSHSLIRNIKFHVSVRMNVYNDCSEEDLLD